LPAREKISSDTPRRPLLPCWRLLQSFDESADGWAPALAAADELSAIAKGAGSVCDQPPAAELEPFVACMKKLAGEEPVLNRAGRRKLIAAQPRERRLCSPLTSFAKSAKRRS
jgi:hypothetical protein